MAFEGLTEKLTNAFKKLRGKGRLTESDVKEAMREIRMALLEADVSYKVVKDFVAHHCDDGWSSGRRQNHQLGKIGRFDEEAG